jgi:hypothetical protein
MTPSPSCSFCSTILDSARSDPSCLDLSPASQFPAAVIPHRESCLRDPEAVLSRAIRLRNSVSLSAYSADPAVFYITPCYSGQPVSPQAAVKRRHTPILCDVGIDIERLLVKLYCDAISCYRNAQSTRPGRRGAQATPYILGVRYDPRQIQRRGQHVSQLRRTFHAHGGFFSRLSACSTHVANKRYNELGGSKHDCIGKRPPHACSLAVAANTLRFQFPRTDVVPETPTALLFLRYSRRQDFGVLVFVLV